MSTVLVFATVGIALIGLLGFLGRRKPTTDLTEWTVSGRRVGAFTMWFLQAGELFTTFTFLGMAGLAYSGGVQALYSLPYVPLGYVVLFFACRRLWRMGKANGYLTQGDYLADRFGSKGLAAFTSILGVVFLLPYLQLQITGLGLIVKLVTGDAASGVTSMIAGTVLVVAFVLWAGLRGVAVTSYFKDIVMLATLAILIVAVPVHIAGGIPAMFRRVAELRPEMLTVHAGPNDHTWFVTSMLVSAIGVGFMTLPHQWPAFMSARSPKVMRRNYIWLPVYSLCLLFPMIIGFGAILVFTKSPDPNSILLALSQRALPDWVTGLVVVGAIATAMVPAAGILIGISSSVARNVVQIGSARGQFWVNQASVVVACMLALVLAIVRPGLLADLLLLTYSGSIQLAPAVAVAFRRRRNVGAAPIVSGIVTGEAVVIGLTFWAPKFFGTFNVGLIGLGANLVAVAAHTLLRRTPKTARIPEADAATSV